MRGPPSMKKVLIAILLIVSMWSMTIQADALSDQQYAGDQLKTLGILKGYEDGTLGLEKNITRAEIATMMVRIQGYDGLIIAKNGFEFKDILKDHWAYLNVQNAYKLGVVSGYPDGTFKPGKQISYAEMVAMMVKTLTNNQPVEGTWPSNYIDKGKSLGVIPTTSTIDPGKIINRGEAAKILWDTLVSKKAY